MTSLPLATRWGGAELAEGRGRDFGRRAGGGAAQPRGRARGGVRGAAGASGDSLGQGWAWGQCCVAYSRPSGVPASPPLSLLPAHPRPAVPGREPSAWPLSACRIHVSSLGLRLSPQVSGKPASPRDRHGTGFQAVPFAGGREGTACLCRPQTHALGILGGWVMGVGTPFPAQVPAGSDTGRDTSVHRFLGLARVCAVQFLSLPMSQAPGLQQAQRPTASSSLCRKEEQS